MFDFLKVIVILAALAIYGYPIVKNLQEMKKRKDADDIANFEGDYCTIFCTLGSLIKFDLVPCGCAPCGCNFAGYDKKPEYETSFIFTKNTDVGVFENTYPIIQRIAITCPNCKTSSVYDVSSKNLSYIDFTRNLYQNTYA